MIKWFLLNFCYEGDITMLAMDVAVESGMWDEVQETFDSGQIIKQHFDKCKYSILKWWLTKCIKANRKPKGQG